MALALMIALVATTADAHVRQIPKKCRAVPAVRLCAIHHHVRATNRLRQKMGQHSIPYHWVAEGHPNRRPRILVYWTKTHRHTLRRYRNRPAPASSPWSGSWYRAALCVHSHEGAWNDPNAPYWGGMQMDMSFQAAYGPEFLRAYGTADHWPAHDQLLAAYRAWRSRGWTPWPSTAAMCGLL